MKLRELEINNFKSIRKLRIRFNNLTFLIGRNNSGKTAILEAIQLLFSILRSVREDINLEQIADPDLRDQIQALWFYNNRDEPITIRAVMEFDVERFSEEIRKTIEKECGLEEELHGLECTVTVEHKGNSIELAVKELAILGCATVPKKEILKSDRKERPTPCRIIDNYNILNTRAVEAVRKLLEDKIKIVIPATLSIKERLDVLGSLAHALRRPVISESLIESIKDAKSVHKYQNLYFSLTRRVEGAESFFERPHERDTMSKIYYYGTGYMSLPFPSFGSGSQTVDAITASIVTAKPGTIVLVEEPETHQHPTFVKRLARVMEDMAEKQNIQIISTTHSPIFVSALRSKENVITVHKEYDVTPFGKVPATQITKAGEDVLKHLDIMVSELGVPVSVPFFADAVILVEGGSDKIILDYIIELLSERNLLQYLPTLHYEVVPFAQTPGSIEAWINMLSRYGVKTFVVVDGDREGEEYIKRAEKQGLKYGENVFALAKEDILCYIPGKELVELIKEVLESRFNVKDRLKDKPSILDRLEQLYKEMESGKSCKKALSAIASIIFDNVLDGNEKEFLYRNSKDLLERMIKMEVAKKAVYRDVFKAVPRDILIVLREIDGRAGAIPWLR